MLAKLKLLLLCYCPKEDQQRHSLQKDLRTAPGMRSRRQPKLSAMHSFSVVKNIREFSFHAFHKPSQQTKQHLQPHAESTRKLILCSYSLSPYALPRMC